MRVNVTREAPFLRLGTLTPTSSDIDNATMKRVRWEDCAARTTINTGASISQPPIFGGSNEHWQPRIGQPGIRAGRLRRAAAGRLSARRVDGARVVPRDQA